MDWNPVQIRVCERFNVPPLPASLGDKVGISRLVTEGVLPINGMRIVPTAGTTGWYIWAGVELSEVDDFFVPLHASHLESWCPLAMPYLLLPPGWRFLVTPDYEPLVRIGVASDWHPCGAQAGCLAAE
jgi:hypothetical protein